jgi:hypothetical protein
MKQKIDLCEAGLYLRIGHDIIIELANYYAKVEDYDTAECILDQIMGQEIEMQEGRE